MWVFGTYRFHSILVVKKSQYKSKRSRPREIFEEILKKILYILKNMKLASSFFFSNLTNLPKLRFLLSLATGVLALLIKEVSYLYLILKKLGVYGPPAPITDFPQPCRECGYYSLIKYLSIP